MSNWRYDPESRSVIATTDSGMELSIKLDYRFHSSVGHLVAAAPRMWEALKLAYPSVEQAYDYLNEEGEHSAPHIELKRLIDELQPKLDIG